MPTEAKVALGEGKMLAAVKILREREGVDLKGAQARVDEALKADPALNTRYQERAKEGRRTLIRLIVVVDAIVFAAVIYYFFVYRS
ncbi:MAG: hypothetical protein R3E72_09665 [Steroidobacteraceae bacterium]